MAKGAVRISSGAKPAGLGPPAQPGHSGEARGCGTAACSRAIDRGVVNPVYLDTARLMARIAPLVLKGEGFALRGGTAINLFIRDLPRLSIDLDLVCLDHALPHERAFDHIAESLRRSEERLEAHGYRVRRIPVTNAAETRLLVRQGNLEIRVGVSAVMRGTVHPSRMLSIGARASTLLMCELQVPVVSLEDAYGGKLAVAMERQHPRDLFDILQLFQHEARAGIPAAVRRAFVVYLACYARPMHEVLFPPLKPLDQGFWRSFKGLTAKPVELSALLVARERMMHELQNGLDADERRFLLSLAINRPDCSALGIPHLEELPGIRWKLRNLSRLERENPRKFMEQAELLACRLG